MKLLPALIGGALAIACAPPRAADPTAPCETPKAASAWQRATLPLEWDGRQPTSVFGTSVSFNGELLLVASDNPSPGQTSALYLFASVRQKPSGALSGLTWLGQYSMDDGKAPIGQVTASCAGNRFVAASRQGPLLLAGDAQHQESPRLLVMPSGVELEPSKLACDDASVVSAGTRGPKPVLGRWSVATQAWQVVTVPASVRSIAMNAGRVAVSYENGVSLFDASLRETATLQVEKARLVALSGAWLFVALERVGVDIFHFEGTQWVKVSVLQAPSAVTALAASDKALALGMPFDDESERVGGSVQLYVQSAGHWTLSGTIVPNDAVAEKGFGSALSLANNELVIGAPGNAFVAGAVYLVDLLEVTRDWTLSGWRAAAKGRVSPFFYTPLGRYPT
jgi:hypothetical protein